MANLGPLAKGLPHSLVANNVAANVGDPRVTGKFGMRSNH